MCRHLAWIGAPRPLADAISTPPHSLITQSWAARELLRGSICADGFGVGWYPANGGPPARYRRELPIWADSDLVTFAQATVSTAFVGAVRNGTPGIPGGLASTQPVSADGYLASHNGFLANFHHHAAELRGMLPDDLSAQLSGQSDSETLLLLAIARARSTPSLVDALAETLEDVVQIAPGSALCVIVSDGTELAVSRLSDGMPCDSLYFCVLEDGCMVASEPLDAHPGWTALPASAVTRVTSSGVVA